jgi:hypothetical protein
MAEVKAQNQNTQAIVHIPLDKLYELIDWPLPVTPEAADKMSALLNSAMLPIPGKPGCYRPTKESSEQIWAPMESWSADRLSRYGEFCEELLLRDPNTEGLKEDLVRVRLLLAAKQEV